MIQTIQEKIKQRRRQMIVHSYIYYHKDDIIVSDDIWQRWAQELVTLQKECKEELGVYDEIFEDWDGSTGIQLPVDEWVVEVADALMKNKA